MRAAVILAAMVLVCATALAFAQPRWMDIALPALILFWGVGSLMFQADWRKNGPLD